MSSCSFGCFWIYIKCRLTAILKQILLFCETTVFFVNEAVKWVKLINSKVTSPQSHTRTVFMCIVSTFFAEPSGIFFIQWIHLMMVLIYRSLPLWQVAPLSGHEKCWPACSHQHKNPPWRGDSLKDTIVVQVMSGEMSREQAQRYKRAPAYRTVLVCKVVYY